MLALWNPEKKNYSIEKRAIALANKVFNSPTHRPNVPKVMVVVATGLKKGSLDPIPVATAFKDFGGIIITI
ncbi:hypothetical protein NECAME_15661, partial [Necator americanus]